MNALSYPGALCMHLLFHFLNICWIPRTIYCGDINVSVLALMYGRIDLHTYLSLYTTLLTVITH